MFIFLNIILLYYRFYFSILFINLYYSINKWINIISINEHVQLSETIVGKCILNINNKYNLISEKITDNKYVAIFTKEYNTLLKIIYKSTIGNYKQIILNNPNDITQAATRINELFDKAYATLSPSEKIMLNNSESIKKYKEAINKIIKTERYMQKIEDKNLGDFDIALKSFLNKM